MPKANKRAAARKKRSKRSKAATKHARKDKAKRTLAKKSKSEVRRVGTKVASEPQNLAYFDVDEDGTIIEPDFTEPKINSEIFDVSVNYLSTPKNIIYEIEQADAKWNMALPVTGRRRTP
jgi:hypothetical protein